MGDYVVGVDEVALPLLSKPSIGWAPSFPNILLRAERLSKGYQVEYPSVCALEVLGDKGTLPHCGG